MTKEELYYLPASELLKHIQVEKERLIKEKVIKKSKTLPAIKDEEKPYGLPDNWKWVRLGDLSKIVTKQTGFDYSKHIKPNLLTYEEKNTIPMIQTKNFSGKEFNFKTDYHIPIDIAKNFPNILLDEQCLLISIVGASVGNVGHYTSNITALLGGAICRVVLLNKNLYPFIYYYLKSPTGQKEIKKNIKSTAQETITVQNVREICIPLPPLYIQDQIVQKLEQLSESKESLLSQAEYQFNYTKKMREALLQEAIRGELVSQNEFDEPASVLLEKIKAEKERLIKEKVIKKSKYLPVITDEEKPYELPDGWEWVRLGELVSKIGSGSTPKGGSKVYKEYGIKFIRSQNVYNDGLRLDDIAFISEETHEKMKGTQVFPNDLLLNITGGSIGRCSLISKDFDTANVNQHVSIIRLIKGLNPRYFHKALISTYIQTLIMDVQVGMSREGLSKEKIELFPVPLPPLAEQDRIVTKLDELMVHCDLLEVKAKEIKNHTTKLFESSLKEAFMPE